MRMLRISSVDDLVINSMNILEPSLVDCDGKQREDGTLFLSLLIYFLVPNVKIHFTFKKRKLALPFVLVAHHFLIFITLHGHLCESFALLMLNASMSFELSLFPVVHQYDRATWTR